MLIPDGSHEPTPDQPTRQQLDELDALMQRMLALPVSGPEEQDPAPVIAQDATAPAANGARRAMEEAAAAARVRVDFRAETLDQLPAPEASQGKLAAEPVVFEDFRFDLPPVRRPAVVETAVPEVRAPVAEEEPLPAPLPMMAARPTVIVAAWLRPLLWCNQLYDGATLWLGPLGRWLRGERARGLLGWTGIVLLAAAFSWVAVEGIGWIW